MIIKIDRELFQAAVNKAKIGLGASVGNDQTVFFKFVIEGKLIKLYATDLIISTESELVLEDSYEHLAFTIHGLNLDKMLPYLTESSVEIEPYIDDLYIKISCGSSHISVRSIPVTQYKDISGKFADIVWKHSISREEFINALSYVSFFAGEKENHPELSQVAINKGHVYGGDIYQTGIYSSPAVDEAINIGINVPLVPRLLRAFKLMSSSHVSISYTEENLIFGEDGFHLVMKKPSVSAAPLYKLLDLPVENLVEADRQYFDKAVRLVSVPLENGTGQMVQFDFISQSEFDQFLKVSVDVNGRFSDDSLPVKFDVNKPPVKFKINYKDVLNVIGAIKLNVFKLSYDPEKEIVRFAEEDLESGVKTCAFVTPTPTPVKAEKPELNKQQTTPKVEFTPDGPPAGDEDGAEE